MRIVGAVLLVISIVAFLLLLFYKKKGLLDNKVSNKLIMIISGILGVVTLASLLLFAFGIIAESKLEISTWRTVFVVSMSLGLTGIFYFFFLSLWCRNHILVDKEKSQKIIKIFNITNILSVVLIFVFVTLYLESISPYLTYPLNKLIISFGDNRGITYYAVFIVTGALTTYFISDYSVAKAGYGHGKLETCLYLAFPSGIIGARIWYVIANWSKEFAGYEFGKVFRIWEGGLAIQGGIILGAAVGIAYMMWKHKEIPILMLIDIVAPAILLAQAIGRWGNFMNKEVYGSTVLIDAFPWSILPTWIKNQMMVTGDPTKMYVPLFLVESICNVLGYFLIAFAVGKGLKKYLVPGDQGLLYLVVYGIIRAFLEPLRDPEFIMGEADGVMRSRNMSIAFIAIGILGIVALHLWHYFKKKKVQDTTQKL